MRSLLALALVVLVALAIWFVSGRGGDAVDVRPPPSARAFVEPANEAPSEPPAVARVDAPTDQRAQAVAPDAPTTRAQLVVRVLARGTGAPLARARVGLASTEPNAVLRDVERSTGTIGEYPVSDADGRATFDVDSGRAYELTVRGAESVGKNARQAIDALAPGETRSLDVELDVDPDLVFHARVIDRDTRAPVANARVVAETPDARQTWTTDADGRFRAELRSWRTLGLRVTAAGRAERWVGPSAGHETAESALEIELERGATLRVEVLAVDRVPIAAAQVRVEAWIDELASGSRTSQRSLDALSWSADTGPDGIAVLDGLPPNARLRGSMHRGGRRIRSEADPIELAPGETRDVTWVLGAGGDVRGIVREADGTPVAGHEIWLQRATTDRATYFRPFDESQARRGAKTDADGAFRFADVAPGGWWVGPAHPGIVGVDATKAAAPIGAYVDMTGASVDLDVRLARGHVIRGRIVGSDGKTPVRGGVFARHASEPMFLDPPAVQSSDFVVGPLVPGRWVLQAHAGGGTSAEVEANAGDVDVVLALRKLGRVDVRVVDPSGAAVANLAVQVANDTSARSGRTDAQGACTFVGIESGPIAASVVTDDGRWAQRADLALDGAAPLAVELALEPGVRARVRCVSAPPNTRFVVLRGDRALTSFAAKSGEVANVTLPTGACVLRALVPGGDVADRTIDALAGSSPEYVYDGAWK